MQGDTGHGSMPFRMDNALVKAAAVVQRLAEYRPAPAVPRALAGAGRDVRLPDELAAPLLDAHPIDDALEAMPNAAAAAHLHACTHPTFSPNLIDGLTKANAIRDSSPSRSTSARCRARAPRR